MMLTSSTLSNKPAREQGLTLWQITPDNLFSNPSPPCIKGEKTFNTLLDRSQGEDRFLPDRSLGKGI